MKVHGAQFCIFVFLALLGLQVKDNECRFDFTVYGFHLLHETLVVFWFGIFPTKPTFGESTSMGLDLISLQQGATFPLPQPVGASLDSLADAGLVPIVVCLLLDMIGIAGLTVEVSVAVWTIDPLFIVTGEGLVTIWALLAADMVFHSLVGFVAQFTEIAGIVELNDG